MVQLSIKMMPESGSNQYAHNFASLLVQVELGCEFRLKADYSFVIYSESLWLMAVESTWKLKYWHHAWRAGRKFTMTMRGKTVWMPGKYFFLIAARSGEHVIRFDLELDDKCHFTVGAAHRCEPLGLEEVLVREALDDFPCHRSSDCRSETPWLQEQALDDVVHGFFSHPDLMGYCFTPAAADKVCRLLIANAQKGPVYLCSKHYYAALVYENMAGRLNDFLIDVDDIDDDEFLS